MKHKAMTIMLALVLIAGFAASVASAKGGDRHEGRNPEGVPFKGSITAAYTGALNPGYGTPSGGAKYCGTLDLPLYVLAHGYGYSSLGALSFALEKTMGLGQMQGCATFTARNGDELYANYVGTTITGGGAGTLTFAGGTGKFDGATGSATFTGHFVNPGMAFYLVEGTVYLAEDDDERD
jgi:hypothetical protein